MKRFISILLVLAMVMAFAPMTVLAAEEKTTISVIAAEYGSETANWWADFEKIYETKYPEVDLVVDVLGWGDIYNEVYARIEAGNAPDVLNLDSFAEFQGWGMLLSVEDYMSDSTYAKFYEDFLNQSKVDGKIWAVSDLTSARAMYYNKDMLEAVGAAVPTDWNEVWDACEKIKDYYGDAVIPWGLDVSENEGQAAFGLYTWNCGSGGFTDENGDWALNSPENVEIIWYMVRTMHEHGLTNGTDLSRYDIQSLFDDGQVAMTIAPDSFRFMLDGAENGVNYGVAPIPAFAHDGVSLGVMDRMMCFDNGYSEEELAAVTAFFDLFYEDEIHLAWTQMEGFLPATSTAAALLAEMDPAMAVWEDVLANCEFYPVNKAEWSDVRNGVIEVLAQVIEGGDVQQLLDDLQAQVTGTSAPSEPSDKTELSVLAPYYGDKSADWWAQFEVDFEAAYENIDLVLNVVSWNDIYTITDTWIANGDTPDILNIDSYAKYQAEGLLLPVEEYMSESTYAKFHQGFLDQSKADGKIWAVPDLTSAETLYYNTRIFEELGLEAPATWDDVKNACAAIEAYMGDEVIPWGMDVGEVNGHAAFAFYTWANGGGFVDEADNWALNSTENVEAIEYAVDLYENGYANGTDLPVYDIQNRFAQGEVAMMITSGTAWTGDLDYGVALIPANEGRTSSSIGIMDRMMCFDNDYTEEELAAVTAFFDFFYDDERHVAWTQMEGFLPATSTGAALLAEQDPSMAVWEEVLASCKFYPADKAEWGDVRNGVIDVFAQAFEGGDVQQLLDELQARITGGSIEPGDMDGDGVIDDNDVARLLWYTLFNDAYEIKGDADFNDDDAIDDADVAYLLWHTLFPDAYPIG